MGYDLQRLGTGFDDDNLGFTSPNYFRWNIWGWPQILGLAEKYGWRKHGTVVKTSQGFRDNNWEGSYFSNDGQIVGGKDALAMADALVDALPYVYGETPSVAPIDAGVVINIDEEDAAAAASTEKLKEFGQEASIIMSGNKEVPSPEAELAGCQDYIKEFITFLRRGAFQIY